MLQYRGRHFKILMSTASQVVGCEVVTTVDRDTEKPVMPPCSINGDVWELENAQHNNKTGLHG